MNCVETHHCRPNERVERKYERANAVSMCGGNVKGNTFHLICVAFSAAVASGGCAVHDANEPLFAETRKWKWKNIPTTLRKRQREGTMSFR